MSLKKYNIIYSCVCFFCLKYVVCLLPSIARLSMRSVKNAREVRVIIFFSVWLWIDTLIHSYIYVNTDTFSYHIYVWV